MEKINAIAQGLELETELIALETAVNQVQTVRLDVQSTWATFGEVRSNGGSLDTTDADGNTVTVVTRDAYMEFTKSLRDFSLGFQEAYSTIDSYSYRVILFL